MNFTSNGCVVLEFLFEIKTHFAPTILIIFNLVFDWRKDTIKHFTKSTNKK